MKKTNGDTFRGLNVHANEPALTRRELIARGLRDASGLMFLPSIVDILGSKAWAAENGEPIEMIPMLVFDCAGGASLAGNFVVGKQGGPEDFLKSYDSMGVAKSPQNGEAIDKQFGLPMYTNLSKIREGILAATKETTRAKLKMASICNASQDDSTGNMLSPAILASKVGLQGKYFGGLGSVPTDSGGFSASPIYEAPLRPLAISTAEDVVQSLGYGPVLKRFSEAQKESMARAIQKLSGGQVEKLRSLHHGEQLRELTQKGYARNVEYAHEIKGVDPRLDPLTQAIYQIAPGAADNTRVPAIVYNSLKSNCGPGVVTIIGCDYHDGTQATGDTKDLEIGTEIGRAVELASQLNKKLFFILISDGSTYSDPGTRIWRGDAGSKGLAVMGYFDPAGNAKLMRTQLGHFTDGQGVERSTYLGNDPKRAAYAVFANYLAVNQKLGEFANYVPTADFDASLVDSFICFG